MLDTPSSTTVDKVQRALARGDIDGLRRAILSLSDSEREALALELGEETVARMTRSAARRRSARKRGRVIVIHGIMGSLLDAVDPSGDADRIWINFPRLIMGRIRDLELDASGGSTRPDVTIRTVGLVQKVYAPMILELDREWHVRPVAFDWREDIDRSAERLRDAVEEFGQNQPVHIIAHSMGGLVSRRFMQLHPALWRSMQDPDGEAGGRLIMLGTPNRGSYSIPLALSGQEKMIKWLARLDVRHSRESLLRILNSFPGSYQMLPSPAVELGDQHQDLFSPDRWGDHPIQPQLLQRAKSFLIELESAIDPERFVYVAGFDRKTPFLIRIVKDGKFELQETQDGDGRVPHRLGLLEGVPTFWVDENHGDLVKNDEVLDSIHDLLARGDAGFLLRDRPARRALEEDAPAKWIPADEIDPIPPDADAILTRARRSGTRNEPKFDRGEEAELEALVFGDYLGGGDVLRSRKKSRAKQKQAEGRKGTVPTLEVEVCWGDVRRVEGDVYSVGHYQGVRPQYAERALDCAVSGVSEPEDSDRLVITRHTTRGRLRGALGDVYYFPWRQGRSRDRIVAVAGMGRPGSFGMTSLRRLIRGLTLAVSSLPGVQTVCTVLIGAGEGTLPVSEAVRGMVRGLADAMESERMGTTGIRKIRIAEIYRHRAQKILAELKEMAAKESIQQVVQLKVKPSLANKSGGRIAGVDALSFALAATAKAASSKDGSAARRAFDQLAKPIPDRVQDGTAKTLREVAEDIGDGFELHASGYKVAWIGKSPEGQQARRRQEETPVRISVGEDQGLLKAAAITRSTTVPERILPCGMRVVEDLVTRINDPDEELMENGLSFMTRLFFPRDFRGLLGDDGPFVFEVDRAAAQVHWELMAREIDSAREPVPLSTQVGVSRQLRTEYSPAPEADEQRDGPLQALVIGDPGDPKKREDLPGARREALAVYELLKGAEDVEVTGLIGAPNADRGGIPRDVEPATLTRALNLMMHGRFDLLHYSGHGDFDPEDPTRVGWVFDIGMLTSREIQALDEVPSLIVANACLSGRTSRALEGGGDFRQARTEAGLLPSLADEFFHLGVRNYVGTSWEVNDEGAVRFAQRLYRELLADPRPSISEAVRAARAELYGARGAFGKLWAAYQHYGDPAARLRKG